MSLCKGNRGSMMQEFIIEDQCGIEKNREFLKKEMEFGYFNRQERF